MCAYSETDLPSDVLLKPWVGENYTNTDPRVMILGESIYYRNGVPKQEIAKQYIRNLFSNNGEWKDNSPKFFQAIYYCYSSPKHWYKEDGNNWSIDQEDFWKDVAFYEYVQFMQKTAKDRPSSSQWKRSEKPFIEVLNILQPDIVIAIGFATFDNLPNEGDEGKPIKIDDSEMRTWKYKLKSGKATEVLRTHHTSRGFGSEK